MLKRQMDLTLAILAAILLAPVLLIVAAILVITQGRPVLFTQPRVGYKGRIFRLYKFRTMKPLSSHEDPHGMERLTKVGKIIRSLSLDELPSLLNIINGEMSVVGPRPLLVQYLDRYNKEQMRRHDVLPGLTGWAQVNGRNTLSWENKFRHDVWYVDHANFFLDLKVIFLTLKILVWREGINATESDIMEEFDPGLYIIGCGGHAKVVVATLEALDLKVSGFFDDNKSLHGKNILGIPVVGSLDDIYKFKVKKAVIGIGSNQVRSDIAKRFALNWITVVHPHAHVHTSVTIGKGTVVFDGAIIHPDSKIGEHAIINTGAIVEHDCEVGNYAHVCPRGTLTGGVHVGESVMLGAGSSVIPGKTVGSFSTIGAGSVVVKDIPEFSVAVGVPAAVIKNTVSHIQRKKA